MPPKGSGKAAAQEKAAAEKDIAEANKAASPSKVDGGIRKSANTTRGKSPVKEANSKKPSPTKRAASPAKKTASPSKPTSPRKSPAYKASMTRGTRATSAVPEGSFTHKKPSKGLKDAFQKRGLRGTNDNDDDPTQPTDEMLAAFDRRHLTEVENDLIDGIKAMEEHEDANMIQSARILVEQEDDAEYDGRPLDCHTKIYWRCLDLWARRRDGLYPQEYLKDVRDPSPPSSPPKRPARALSRSPAKVLAPSKARGARGVSAGLRQSPERAQSSMSRPLRSETSKTSQSYDRIVSEQASGSGRVSKPTSTSVAPRARSVTVTYGQHGQTFQDFHPNAAIEKYFKQFEDAAYNAMISARTVPAVPTGTKDKAAVYLAQERGRVRAERERGGGLEPMDIDLDESVSAPPVVHVQRGPAATHVHSPGKQRPVSRVPSPAKPHSHAASHSPGKQTVLGKASVTAEPEVYPEEPGRGHLDSSQNPKMIKVKRGSKAVDQLNPFHETMPAPEVWHRRMPPVFPFGETPYMAKVVSDQINADLSRNHADDEKPAPAQESGIMDGIRQAARAGRSVVERVVSPTKATHAAAQTAKKPTSIWDLPEVDESYTQRIKEAAAMHKAANDPSHQKRAGPGHHQGAQSQKRARGTRRGEAPFYV